MILTLLFLSCRTYRNVQTDEKYEPEIIPEFVRDPDVIEQYKHQIELYRIIYSDRKMMEASGNFNVDPNDFLYIEDLVKYLEENLQTNE